MKKRGTIKHADKIKPAGVTVKLPMFETAEEALVAVKEEAARHSGSPGLLMVSFSGGYVTGDGEVHYGAGITAVSAMAARNKSLDEAPEDDTPEAPED